MPIIFELFNAKNVRYIYEEDKQIYKGYGYWRLAYKL